MAVFESLIGNSVILTALVKYPDGSPFDPTGIKLRIEEPETGDFLESPDDLAIEVTASTGKAQCVFRPSQVGVYSYRWWMTENPGGAAEGLFRVRDTMLSTGGAAP